MAKKLNPAKRLLLTGAGIAAVAGPFGIGTGHAPSIHAQTQISRDPAKSAAPAFEVASVKPHTFARNEFAFATPYGESPIRISGNRVTMHGLFAGLMLTAYKLRTFQIEGAPEWRNETGRNQIYDIEARAPGDTPSTEEVRRMLQTLLAERFQLKFHRETRELPAYDLVAGTNRAKLKPSSPDVESRTVRTGRLRMSYSNVTISELVGSDWAAIRSPAARQDWPSGRLRLRPGIYAEPPQYGQRVAGTGRRSCRTLPRTPRHR